MALGADDRMIDIDIELVDADLRDAGPPAPVSGQAEGAGRVPARGRALRRLVQVAAVLVVLVVVVVTNVNERARDARGDAAVAAMPGLVATLDEPLGVVWEGPGFGGPSSGLVFGEVEGEPAPLYPATGEPIPVPIGDGQVRGPCGAVAGAEPAMLVCWHYERPESPDLALPTDTPSPDPAFPEATSPEALLLAAMEDAQVVVVGLVDGAVLGERPAAFPTVSAAYYGNPWAGGFDSVDGDLVVGSQKGLTLTVARVDPLTGVERWTTSFPVPDGDPLAFHAFDAWVEVLHGLVVVHGPTTAVLAADDGRTVGSWARPPLAVGEVRSASARNGADVEVTERGYAVWDGIERGVRALEGTWFGKDGREVGIDGRLAEPEVTDGSDGDVLLLARSNGTQLVGVDLRTGGDLWTAGLRGGEVLMRRDGAAVVSDGQRLVAFDLRSGEERWSRTVDGIKPDAGSVTDGRTIVVVATRDHEWVLEAISLDGGEVSWTALAPPAALDTGSGVFGAPGLRLDHVGSQVVLVGPGAVIGLR